MKRGSERSAQLRRALRILQAIHDRKLGQKLQKPELAALCGCTEKTIQRDLELLAAECGVYHDRRERAYLCPDTDPLTPSLVYEDLIPLALAADLLSAPGMPAPESVRTTLNKLTARLPGGLRPVHTQAVSALLLPTLTRDYSAAPLEPLLDAARRRRVVEMDYTTRSTRRRAWRRVHPYAVEPRLGRFWELHAYNQESGAIQTYALDSMSEVRVTREAFTRDEILWQAFLANRPIGGLRGGPNDPPVVVDILFTAEVADYARLTLWPESLTLTEVPDGGIRLTGTVSTRDGMVIELLRWRRHVRVYGGPELLDAYRAELHHMTQNLPPEKI